MQKSAEICIRRPVFGTMIVLVLVVVGVTGYYEVWAWTGRRGVTLPQIYVAPGCPALRPMEVEIAPLATHRGASQHG
jgi:hypothetical protein